MSTHDKEPQFRLNHRIRVREIRVIASDGQQLGVMETSKALEMARNEGLDLVEVSPTAKPPVCKILDYGKFKYEQKKKTKEAKKKQHVTLTKEIHFRPQTDDHDIEYKVKHIQRFLEDGHKVRVCVRFRGREAAHADLGQKLLIRVIDLVGSLGIVEMHPKMEGRAMVSLLAPQQKAKKAKKDESSSLQAGSG